MITAIQNQGLVQHGVLVRLLARNAVEHSSCDPQAGARGVINAVGRLVQRGVLPSLRRLSLGAVSRDVGDAVPRPDAAPHVETALLPAGRRPPWQLFWVTDDVLPDLHVALGVHGDYDWEREVPQSVMAAVYQADEEEEDAYDSGDHEDGQYDEEEEEDAYDSEDEG